MKVVIRVDASLHIGSGHVMRCLVLADALKKQGYSIYFACLPQPGDMLSYIEERDFHVLRLTAPNELITPRYEADYQAWLQRPELDDALDFIQVVGSADLVIADHYAIGKAWQGHIQHAFNCFVIAIDDLAREHDADLIIDQTLGRNANDYVGRARPLVGSEYAILAPNFASLREFAYLRTQPETRTKVLISMGGIDNPNATLKSLKSLVGNVNADFTVLLSPRAPHYQEVKAWCQQQEEVQHQDFEADMANLMLEHDIAIGAPGTTSWERACLGLPSILIPLADNQQMLCEQLILHEAILKVALDDIDTQLLLTYQKALSQWNDLYTSNLKLCDGLGIRRIVLEIQQLVEPQLFSRFKLSLATHSDIRQVYEWQCHPKTREFALIRTVPTWEEHQNWMQRKLASTAGFFYLVEDKVTGEKLGVLRLDRLKAKSYLVSIFVAPTSYGCGVATAALKMADVIHPDLTLNATVLKYNKASQRLFESAENYIQSGPETFIRHPIL
ncbi:UDP-2,4-diacetamido-2,4,6-trideoxy-beta-L-altropyranose hydrolase [Vibrio sp. 05-20-BW147]|uniref:UDP-2,4-diacetamido-2,4, 6-trideoxy-beta-L-altropyranose hydrolase n=1 Tax=Vibrio sp. 05-20-BW147 TaxID=2575834 RepID=UPI001592EAF3|nr:UDP-2,4-diacetamido-2,4,6-trideoxy-beta-L-altropyranose hydrolase [Vibrio sp. 05-20-BW147]NVC64583.1 UDP-2,4-diacetamido-2,4,6-trideoxy-beta-L-altropyranose hydrolase [Vibrio sp. 05-20-BW147]